MFLQTIPDTSGYMIAGYVIAFLVMALYVASMALRNRNLKQDLTTLEEMDKATEKNQPRKDTPGTVGKRATP